MDAVHAPSPVTRGVVPPARVLGLCNPGSSRIRRRPDVLRPLVARLGPHFREATTAAELGRALEELGPGPGDVLVVAGGDGTLQAVLSELHELAPGADWPVLLPVAAGATNMTATDLGVRSGLRRQVTRFVRWHDAGGAGGRAVGRPLLRVRRPGATALCGMFFGAALVADGVAYFRSRLREVAPPGEHGSLVSIVRVLVSLWRSEGHSGGGTFVETRLEEGSPTARPELLCLATTLHRLVLGLTPYWGGEEAPIHYTSVRAGADRLWRNLPRLAVGRPGSSLTVEGGYSSHDIHRAELVLDGAFVLDGELYEARAEDGPLRLDAPRTVRWRVLA